MKSIKIGPYEKWNVNGRILVIEPKEGFNFGYTIFIPDTVLKDSTLIVEGSNVRLSTENMERAKELVYKDAINPSLPIYSIATELGLPILYPLFPRWFNGNETIYNHMLSSNSLDNTFKEESLKRVDIQLINMIKDCKKVLIEEGINIDDKIIIDGFSASSKFANRFTLLHPEIVKLCIGGGVSGVLTLPLDSIKEEKLLWPIGIGNLYEISNIKVDVDEFKRVRQLYYMGLDDNTNDPFIADETGEAKFSGIIKTNEMKQMHRIFGKKMIEERWKKTQELYNE